MGLLDPSELLGLLLGIGDFGFAVAALALTVAPGTGLSLDFCVLLVVFG